MQIFLDTANVDEIKKANDIIPLDGVTTNPTLIAKEGKDYKETLKEIAGIVDGWISAETVSLDAEGMVTEGEDFAKIHKNIIIKVPLTEQGLKACRILSEKGIKVNVTLCFSPNQALMAARAGAFVVSPFVGRMDDIGHTGMDLIEEIRQIYDNYGFETGILVASIRSPLHVKDAAMIGADISTMPYKVWQSLFKHTKTDEGIQKFLDDWDKLQNELKK